MMAGVTSPLMLFLLGAFFRFGNVRHHFKPLLATVIGRLVIIPLLVIIPALLLGFRGDDFVTILIVFATPAAVAGFTMVQQMGGDADLAGDIVVFTSFLCPFTIFALSFVAKSLGYF